MTPDRAEQVLKGALKWKCRLGHTRFIVLNGTEAKQAHADRTAADIEKNGCSWKPDLTEYGMVDVRCGEPCEKEVIGENWVEKLGKATRTNQ